MGVVQPSSVAALGRELRLLYENAGSPSYGFLIRQGDIQPKPIKLTQASLSDWLSARSVPSNPRTFSFLVSILEGRAARKEGYRKRSIAWWESIRLAAQSEKRRKVSADADSFASASADVHDPLGPIGSMEISYSLDPFDFEVHRAIEVGAHQLDPLPVYIPRAHDETLRSTALRAISGDSQILVLVGGSSTGKTRACWEAVHRLPEGWRVWHPIDPSRPESVLTGIEDIGPRTVVWLNESQHYLLTPNSFLGEKVAAALRQLLRNPSVAPVLILGTLWPEYWDEITSPPKAGEIERHSQASALIRNSVVSVPDSFADSEIDHLKQLDNLDPRIKSALKRATDGCLTQYLAGGPALLERYHNSPPLARALIHAAMDCRRFGHSPAVPFSLLEGVAHFYVSDRHWDEAPDDWLERSFAYTGAPCRGARGVLTRIRSRPGGHGLKEPHYILSDFIEQHLRRSRRWLAPPAGLWQEFLHHAQPRELEKLASAADSAGLKQIACQMALAVHLAGCSFSWKLPAILENAGYEEQAFQLYKQAAESGDTTSMAKLAVRLHGKEKHDEALAWERKASTEGHLESLWGAVDFLLSQNRSDEAILLCRESADLGHHGALEVGAYVLQENEQVDQAISWYSEAMEKGEESAPYHAGELLSEKGQFDRAREWYLLSSNSSQDTRAMRRIAETYERNGQLDQALVWRQRAAKTGGADVLWGHVIDLALRMDDTGSTAVALLEKEKEDGNEDVIHWLGVLHEKLGNTDKAVEYYLESREWGEDNGYARIARMLESVGEYDRALFYYQAGYEEVDIASLELGCELLHRTEGIESVLEWLEDITDGESFPALLASSFLEKEGRVDDALAWHKRAADLGDSESLVWGAEVLARAGRIDECIQWCWRAASAGELLAKGDLERILRENGEERLADRFARYGWDPDGSVSEGWRLQ